MKKNSLRSRLRFLGNMSFGISLLVFILLLSVIGTLLPQNQGQHFYIDHYSEYIAELIILFGLDHIYTSMLFVVLFSALALNLLFCSTVRLGRIMNQVRQRYDIGRMKEIASYKLVANQQSSTVFRNLFRAYNSSDLYNQRVIDGVNYSTKYVLGYFGSWFLHLGIMLVILFYIFGQITFFSSEIYGVPGETMSLQGTDYKAEIQSFHVNYREDGSIAQYATELKLLDQKGAQLKQGSLQVNDPLRYQGYSFYQTGTGWAADCKIFKAGKLLKDEIVYEKSASFIPEENIAIALAKFYPDFAANDQGFMTLSDRPNNPALLYSIYYRNELVKMDIIKPGDTIAWNEFSFLIDNPTRYTYLKVNKMRGQAGAAIGGLLIVFGLILNFYFKPREFAIKQQGDFLYIYGRTLPGSSEGFIANSTDIEKQLSNKEDVINVH